MARQTKDPLEAVRADIEKRYNDAMVKMAEEMTYQIESAYESVVQQFYNEYTPRSYDRTYSTYLGSDKYNNLFGYTPIENGYESGIIVDSNNIPGNPYRAEKDWVFERTFSEGIHGYFKVEYEQWMNERFKKYKWSKKKTAREKERIEKMLKHAPKKSSPPQKEMDRKFKQLTKPRNMNKICKNIMDEAFKR